MHQRVDSPEHAHYQELLGAVAVDALPDEERLDLARHLVTYPSCRDELAELRAAAQALPLALAEREPPPIVRLRIQAALQLELGQHAVPVPTPTPLQPEAVAPKPTSLRRRIPQIVPWVAAAVCLVAALGLLAWDLSLRNETKTPATEALALQATQANNGAQGRLIYLPDRRIFVVTFEHLPALPVNHVYQVWLIRGTSSVSAGVFGASTDGFAVASNRTDFQTLAITIEPGPLGSIAPTSAPILAAIL